MIILASQSKTSLKLMSELTLPQDSCTSYLSNRPCAVENNLCKCATSDSSSCGTLGQQAFVNLTGASNESASQWTCCFCSINARYCCNKCNKISGLLSDFLNRAVFKPEQKVITSVTKQMNKPKKHRQPIRIQSKYL